MKKLLLCSVALVSLTSGTIAADLPAAALPPALLPTVAVAPAFTWAGFYAGVNAGAGFGTHESSILVPPEAFPVAAPVAVPVAAPVETPPPVVAPPPPGPPPVVPPAPPPPAPPPHHKKDPLVTYRDRHSGFVGGGQIGYNVQLGSFVIGVEADLQAADLGGRAAPIVTPFVPGFVPVIRQSHVDWFGTVRGRAGVAFDQVPFFNQVLLYGTGGFAYGGISDTGFCAGAFQCDNHRVGTGWAAGGGVEWALPVNWFGTSATIVGVEGLWVNLGHRNHVAQTFAGTFDGQPVIVAGGGRNEDTEFGVIRAKLSLKF
jgi:outer membrane immunogenic protein